MNVLRAAGVIARRDFIATVWSRTFLLFLLAPIIALVFGVLISMMTSNADVRARQPKVTVIMDSAAAQAVRDSHRRLADAVGALQLPELAFRSIEQDPTVQAKRLLANPEEEVSAVLTGTLERPILVGPKGTTDRLERPLRLVIEQARQQNLLRGANLDAEPPAVATVRTEGSPGSVHMVRHLLARIGQTLIFALTLLLAGMLLSNLVEEKSNKVIEILAAAVPLDAVFLGKLVAMLGVSIVGIGIWGTLAGMGLLWIQDWASMPVTPAAGWPAYVALLMLYFAANYMLLGGVFLGIGGQASNVREVQTLSMPVTFAQIMVFALASAVVGDEGGTITLIATVFPLSSPMAMIGIAAQSTTLWIHLLALAWQFVWIALIIRFSARMFRRTVLKSQSREGFFDIFRRTKKA